jgi:hypothetical protein
VVIVTLGLEFLLGEKKNSNEFHQSVPCLDPVGLPRWHSVISRERLNERQKELEEAVSCSDGGQQ